MNVVAEMLLYWLQVTVLLGTIVCIHVHAGLGQTFVRTGCEYPNLKGMNLYRQSLQNCSNSCSSRPWCKAIDYFRKERKCSLLRADNGTDLSASNRSCVYVSRDVIENTKRRGCGENDECSKTQNQKTKVECRPFGNLPNSRTLGNILLEGSFLRIVCNDNSRETTGRYKTECTSTGNWSHYPRCLKELRPTIGEDCIDSRDCFETGSICIEEKCFCSRLYRYSTSLLNCVKVCTNMTNEFVEYRGTGILFYDFKHYNNIDIIECKQLCIDSPYCLSFVYTTDDGCLLAVVTIEMLYDTEQQLASVLELTDATTFSRQCV